MSTIEYRPHTARKHTKYVKSITQTLHTIAFLGDASKLKLFCIYGKP